LYVSPRSTSPGSVKLQIGFERCRKLNSYRQKSTLRCSLVLLARIRAQHGIQVDRAVARQFARQFRRRGCRGDVAREFIARDFKNCTSLIATPFFEPVTMPFSARHRPV
jgi:hypothetical protein